MRRALLLALALLASVPAVAFWQSRDSNYNIAIGGASACSGPCMITPVLSLAGSTAAYPSASAINYTPLVGASRFSTQYVTTAVGSPIAVTGTFGNLFVNLGANTLSTYQICLNKNGTVTTLCCVFAGTTSCSDTTDTVSIALADRVIWEICPTLCSAVVTTTALATPVQISTTFTSTVGNESPLIVNYPVSGPSNSATQATSPGLLTAWTAVASEAAISVVVPAAGTIDRLYAHDFTAPGASKGYGLVLYHNGATSPLGEVTSGTACTTQATCSCFVTTGTLDCNDSSATVAVAAGDLISLVSVPVGTPTTGIVTIGLRWTPTTPGQALVFQSNNVTTTTTTVYGNLSGSSNLDTTESNEYNIAPLAMTIHDLYCNIGTAAGSAHTRTFTLRSGGASVGSPSNVACVLSNTTTGSDTTNSYSAAQGELLDYAMTASASATNSGAIKMGAVLCATSGDSC